MNSKSLRIGLCLMVVSLLALAACTPAAGGEVLTLNEDGSTAANSEEGGASSNAVGQMDPGGEVVGEDGQAKSSLPTVVYLDDVYKFSLTQPSDYVLQYQTEENLATLTPKPAAALRFMDPVLAKSEVPDEPAALEVRMHAKGRAADLAGWLKAAGLPSDAKSQEEFKTGNVTGIKICESSMLFPGCRYFVFGEEWVYEMIVTSQEGEFMLNSFQVVPK